MGRATVLMKVSIAGNAEPMYDQPEFAYRPGQVVEINERLAAHWLASGVAARVPEGYREAADKPPACPSCGRPSGELTHPCCRRAYRSWVGV